MWWIISLLLIFISYLTIEPNMNNGKTWDAVTFVPLFIGGLIFMWKCVLLGMVDDCDDEE